MTSESTAAAAHPDRYRQSGHRDQRCPTGHRRAASPRDRRRHCGAHSLTCGRGVKTLHPSGRAQQLRHHMERNIAGVGLAKALNTSRPGQRPSPLPRAPHGSCRCRVAPRRHHAPWPSTARSNKPSTADISRCRPTRIDSAAPDCATLFRHAQQAVGGHRFIGTLDAHHLRLTQSRCVIDQSRCRCAEHHPPGGATDSIRCASPTCSPMVV